jgi:hypothetical protein
MSVRHFPAIIFPGIIVTLIGLVAVSTAWAQEPAYEPIPAPSAEQRPMMTQQEIAHEIARLRYHLYQRIDLPLVISQIDAEIELAEAELQALDRQIQEYQRISRPQGSQPFLVTVESARLRKLSVKLRLKNLRKEKALLLQNHHSLLRLQQLETIMGE